MLSHVIAPALVAFFIWLAASAFLAASVMPDAPPVGTPEGSLDTLLILLKGSPAALAAIVVMVLAQKGQRAQSRDNKAALQQVVAGHRQALDHVVQGFERSEARMVAALQRVEDAIQRGRGNHE